MKKAIFLFIFLISVIQSWSQEKEYTRIPLIGEMTPEFTAQSTTGRITFPDDYFMKWKIIFSHPADFTPVCSSELLQLASMQEEFDRLKATILVISTDGLSSHLAWVSSLESLSYPGEEPVKIKFPLIADKDLEISKKFGMIHSYTSNTRDVRGVFIIDPGDRIAAVFFYPMNIGRNMEEIKRTLIALQTSEKFDVLTPSGWEPGKDVLVHAPASQQDAEMMAKKGNQDLTMVAWYLWFRKLPNGGM
jgi:peroxiredoxin (alkyl hydroperoxide reductase subunit C)